MTGFVIVAPSMRMDNAEMQLGGEDREIPCPRPSVNLEFVCMDMIAVEDWSPSK
jgi:hypothetical protein